MEQRYSIMNLHDSSKRQKDNSALVDSISGLPDSILGLVLSFLPTPEAVATSILSKRWKFVWVTVNKLDFYYEGCEEDEGMNFVRFVDRVMSLHDAGLRKFSLCSIAYCISSYASPWIGTAIAKNVHDLSLSGELDLPVNVFSCDSLRSLELVAPIYVPAVFAVCLPRLESLKLEGVDFNSEEVFEKLISGCPMLNYLMLYIDRDDDDDDGFTYIISSTSLRRVELSFDYNCSVKLKASSLEYLKVHGCIPEIFEQKSLSSLVEAYFSIRFRNEELYQADICNSIVKVVRAFDCAKVVSLSAHVMRALSCATVSLSTEFKRLVKLEAGIYCISLRDFIQSSDDLEDVAINKLTNNRYESNLHDLSKWITPVEVPRCLSNSLKKVQLRGYKGLEDEREMIRYLLKHGSALEVMKIKCAEDKNGEEFELVQEICGFPRKSSVCEVQFSGGAWERRYKFL